MVITLIPVGTDVFFMYYCLIPEPFFFFLSLVSEDSLMKIIFFPLLHYKLKGNSIFSIAFPLSRFS